MSDKPLLSVTDLSKYTGFDRRTISERISKLNPIETKGRAVLYDSAAALERIYITETKGNLDKKIQQVSLQVEQERLRKLQIENDESEGRLVKVEDAAKALQREYSYVRAQIRRLPSSLAKPLSMISDAAEVQRRLEEAVDETLQELTADRHYEQLKAELDSTDPEILQGQAANVGSAAAPESSGMGGSISVPQSGIIVDSRSLEDK